MEVGPIHYRFRTEYDGDGIIVIEERWHVAKATECGFWINPAGFGYEVMKGVSKFVLKVSRRRYAYPDRQEAWKSFCIRRRRYEKHLRYRAMCNAALVASLPGAVPDVEGPITIGLIAYNSPKVLDVRVPEEQFAEYTGVPSVLLDDLPL